MAVITDGAALPLVCRWPEEGAPRGFIVFCHGLGAGGRDYAELSHHWASHGYLVIHPTFPDWFGAVAAAEPDLGLDQAADSTDWLANPTARARMFEILHTPFYWMERIRIVGQVMDSLDAVFAATCGPPSQPMPGAITGHSFGAYTSQLFAGAVIDVPGEGRRNFKDNRFAAAILLSAQGRNQQGLREGSWDGMTGPVLNVTGTQDGGAKGQDWRWKVEPYELAPPGDKYLALLTGADHYLGGIAVPQQAPVPEQKDAVFQLTLAFLDAHLPGDATAKAWLLSITDRIGECPMVFKRK
jgi:pimeloyl-ACP methyl ester carboxylesterase